MREPAEVRVLEVTEVRVLAERIRVPRVLEVAVRVRVLEPAEVKVQERAEATWQDQQPEVVSRAAAAAAAADREVSCPT
jgi:hypothetical protein